MADTDTRTCPVCGKTVRFQHDRFQGTFYCTIGCPEHGNVCGQSLDNAIEAQRDAEELWDTLHKKETKHEG